jgi:hypothetical protein
MAIWFIVPVSVCCTKKNLTTLPLYTPAGFDLTTHNSAGGDDTFRPRRQGNR